MLSVRRAALAAILAFGGAASLAQPARAQEEATLRIECEDFAEKVSDDVTFAGRTAREPAASGRRSLIQFFKPGHLVYRFSLPADGTWCIWLRYGSNNDVPLRHALDPAGEPEWSRQTLPSTGGYIGPGVWGWAKLVEAELAKGEHTLALGNATIRPDCLYITQSAEEPTDALIQQPVRKLDPVTAELVKAPLVPVRPSWLDGAADYELPAWYGEHRVHLHTRLSPQWFDKDVFWHAAEAFKTMGVHTFARHIKSGGEAAWWPSAVGEVLPAARERNIAKEVIDEAHAQGMRILVYHRHMEDEPIAEAHPEWLCRTPDGDVYTARGRKLCFNSPYADYFLQRSLELVDLGADAFYYDEVHMPKDGCWCDNCKRKFRQETGLDHPADADPDDPVWHKLIDFNNLTIERTFLKWRKALHDRNPELVMLIGSNTWPTMSERHMTGRLFRIADSMKTEFSLPVRAGGNRIFDLDPTMKRPQADVRLALGYTLARDSADGRPAHIWTHGLLDETSALYATAGMVTHGCIANLDVAEPTIPNMMFKPAFELGDRVSAQFAGAKPLRWAAIHYSEYARDQYMLDETGKWKKVLYPVYGAYHALLRAHLPVGIVTDSQLEEGLLQDYKVLVIPAPDHLTDGMRAQIDRFRAAGGLVVQRQPDWVWHDPEGGQEKAIAAFIESVRPAIEEARVRVSGGPEKMHSVAFTQPDGDVTVSLCSDFSWVYTGPKPDAERIPELTKTPPPCEGVEVTLRGFIPATRVFDAVTGQELEFADENGTLRVRVPAFDYMAVIVAEFEWTGAPEAQ